MRGVALILFLVLVGVVLWMARSDSRENGPSRWVSLVSGQRSGAIPSGPGAGPVKLGGANAHAAPADIEDVLSAPSASDSSAPAVIGSVAPVRPEVTRERLAQIDARFKRDPSGVARGVRRLRFRLFEDAVVVGTVDRFQSLGSERGVCHGSLEGREGGDFTLAFEGDVIAATIFDPRGATYQIRYAGGGMHRVMAVDPSRLPRCGLKDPVAASRRGAIDVAVGRAVADAATRGGTAAAHASTGVAYGGFGQQGGEAEGLVPTSVDVYVVYTADARVAAGGTAGMNAVIDLAIARANAAFINSQAGVRLWLVGRLEVAYAETGNLSTDLNRLSAPADGHLDAVHGQRNALGADLVCLFVNNTGAIAGLAQVYNGSSDTAFSVVGQSSAESTFVHEIGHNFGCLHDRPNNTIAPPPYAFGYGWSFTPSNAPILQTIMAQGSPIRVPYFSNPDVTYMGVPTGVPSGQTNESDNAQVLDTTVSAISGFRSPSGNVAPAVGFVSPAHVSSFGALEDIPLEATASDGDGTVQRVAFYRLKGDSEYGFSNYGSMSLGADTVAPYRETNAAAGAGFWTYVAVATDDDGAVGAASVSIAVNPHYAVDVLPLPSVVGSTSKVEVTGLDDHGRMVGYVNHGAASSTACLWENGGVKKLNALPGDADARALAIDAEGNVYGESGPEGGATRAARWAAGQTNGTDLSAVVGGLTFRSARGADQAGRILVRESGERFYRLDGGVATILPLNARGEAINRAGTTTGYDYSSASPAGRRAMRWDSGSSSTLLSPNTDVGASASSWGWDIADSGTVAGITSPSSGGWSTATSRATAWLGGSTAFTDLGTLGGPASWASGVNSWDDIVGLSDDTATNQMAFVRLGEVGVMCDLNDLVIPPRGLRLTWAKAINDLGQIGVVTYDGFARVRGAALLTPLVGLSHPYWQRNFFSESEIQSGLAADDADGDGDGRRNLLERVFGSNPRVADATGGGGPTFRLAQGGDDVLFAFNRPKSPRDMILTVEYSTTLAVGSWSSADVQLEGIEALDRDYERVTYRIPFAGSPPPRIFVRLRVER